MESIQHYRTDSRRERRNRSLKLLPFVRLVFAIMIGFGAATISAKVLGQYVAAPTNPFLEFADIFPGQPESAVYAYPFLCRANYAYDYASEKHCNFRPSGGIFSVIDLIVEHSVIIQATFMIRDTSVRLGDLKSWWETNPVQAYPRVVFFFLPEWAILARTSDHGKHSPPFSPVWSVTFVEASAVS